MHQHKSNGNILTLISLFLIIIFQAYNIAYLPVIDFRPYRIGADIAEKMSIPSDAQTDRYETTFIYSKDGQEKEFSLENYPGGDSTWVFVDQKSTLISKGYTPEITSFVLISTDHGDITHSLLSSQEETVLMISADILKISKSAVAKAIAFKNETESKGNKFYMVTSSPEYYLDEFMGNFDIIHGDETMLKTIIRSNPGFVTLKNGIVIRKNSWRGLSVKNYSSK